MCGVLAFISPDTPLRANERARLGWESAMQSLDRRGPDARGEWASADGTARLGHTRLAIQDLSQAGTQPMVIATPSRNDGALYQTAITYNGEIYNAPALRHELERSGEQFTSRCDTEVVLRGYTRWGVDTLLEKLRGMFAFVIWDGERKEIVAAVDHAGMKPLVYAMGGGEKDAWFAAASECDALRRILPDEPAVDADSMARVLTIGYCPAPSTMWRGVRKLGPGRVLRWSSKCGVRVMRYWSPQVQAGTSGGARDFEPIWRAVVEEHTLSDVPIGLFLSGGIDSAAVAVALAEAGWSGRCTAFTLAMPASEADESDAASALARHLGMKHERVELGAFPEPHETKTETSPWVLALESAAEAFDEPQAATSLLAAAAIAHAARTHARVVLAGDGGDEAFAGYHWHRAEAHPLALSHAAQRRANPEHASLARLVAFPGADASTREAAMWALGTLSFAHATRVRQFGVFHPAEAAALLAPLGASLDNECFVDGMNEDDDATLAWRRRSQKLDLAQFCAGHALPKIDRASMNVGLELRAPFLDRRVLEYALSLPDDPDEDRPGGGKPTLRRYLAEKVPAGYLNRPKQGFSLRSDKRDVWWSMADWLDSTPMVQDGLIRRDWRAYVPAMRDFRETRMFALCMLAAWHARRVRRG